MSKLQLRNKNLTILTKEELIKMIEEFRERHERRMRYQGSRRRRQRNAGLIKDEFQAQAGVKITGILSLIFPNWHNYTRRRAHELILRVKSLLLDFPDRDHRLVAEKMMDYCSDHNKKPGLLRYRNFLNNAKKWGKDSNQKDDSISDLEERERQKAKDDLEKYG